MNVVMPDQSEPWLMIGGASSPTTTQLFAAQVSLDEMELRKLFKDNQSFL
jgi:hypothetical protein